MAQTVRYVTKGYFLVNVLGGLSPGRWEMVEGARGITFTPSSVTPNSDDVFDDDGEDYTFGSDTSDASISIDEIVWNPGGDGVEYFEDNINQVVSVKVCLTRGKVLYTSPGAVANTIEYVVEDYAAGTAFVGSRKFTISKKGTATLPDTKLWTRGQFVKITETGGPEFYRISRRIDATNFVITKPGDDFAKVSTIPEVASAEDAEFKVGQFPLILGTKDSGFEATVLSAGESSFASGDVAKGSISIQPVGNRISSRTRVDFGDAALAPTVAT